MSNFFKKSLLGTIFILCVVIAVWAHYVIVDAHTNDLQKRANERIGFYQQSLNNELNRFSFLPFVIARDKQLVEWALEQPQKANLALEAIKQNSGANEVYIMDTSGLTLAASNWGSKVSFVGKNYAYRPYFKQAIMHGSGQFFGIGATSKKPGFFISNGVQDQNNIIAVTVAKVDLSVIEKIWVEGGENIFITNRDGVVILSSQAKWKYHTLSSLDELQLETIAKQRQFDNKALPLLAENLLAESDGLTIEGVPYLHQAVEIKTADWKLHYLIPQANVVQLTIITWTKIGLILLGVLAVFLFL